MGLKDGFTETPPPISKLKTMGKMAADAGTDIQDATPTICSLCDEISKEADAIKSYTSQMGIVWMDTVEMFNEIRLDELEHLQQLVTALSDLLNPEEKGREET